MPHAPASPAPGTGLPLPTPRKGSLGEAFKHPSHSVASDLSSQELLHPPQEHPPPTQKAVTNSLPGSSNSSTQTSFSHLRLRRQGPFGGERCLHTLPSATHHKALSFALDPDAALSPPTSASIFCKASSVGLPLVKGCWPYTLSWLEAGEFLQHQEKRPSTSQGAQDKRAPVGRQSNEQTGSACCCRC